MATRSLAIRAALITELQKIGVTPASGWESGSGAPTVLAGRPRKNAIDTSIERQIWVQHGGTIPMLDGFTFAGGHYRAGFNVWIVCPDPVGGEDMASKLEKDVRRAIQLNEAALQAEGLANAGFYESDYAPRDEMIEAGIYCGILQLFAEYLTLKGE